MLSRAEDWPPALRVSPLTLVGTTEVTTPGHPDPRLLSSRCRGAGEAAGPGEGLREGDRRVPPSAQMRWRGSRHGWGGPRWGVGQRRGWSRWGLAPWRLGRQVGSCCDPRAGGSRLEVTRGETPVRKEGRSAQNRELLGPGRGPRCWTGHGLGPSCPVLSLKQRWPHGRTHGSRLPPL